MKYFVFTKTDPRNDGYEGDVIENVILDGDADAVHLWPDGTPRPDPQLGNDPADPKHYRVFKFLHELQAAGYQLVDGNAPLVMYSWQQYRRQFPDPKKLESQQWEKYLDEIDEITALRRKDKAKSELPASSDRDQIAEWVAKRHLSADGSIRQILYLPQGAPAKEIRLLEVNNRMSLAGDRIEPIDFGLDVGGGTVKLFVADVTKEQLERVRTDPSQLPPGWGWDGARVWGAGRD